MKDNIFQHVSLGQPVKVHAVNPVEASSDYRVSQLLQAAETAAQDIIAAAQRDAQHMLHEARETARHLVEQAHQRASAIEDEALAQRDERFEAWSLEAEALGREAGLSQGYEAAALETLELIQAAHTLMQGVKDAEQVRLNTIDAAAVQLMQAILKAVSKTVWQAAPVTLLAETWHEAMRVFALKGATTLLIHPAQLQMIEALGEEATQLLEQLPGVRLKTDASISVDAVYLLHEDHNLNLTLTSIIEQQCQGLLAQLNANPTEAP